jgi:hypothetical protein
LLGNVRSLAVLFGLDGTERAGASRSRTYAREPAEMFAPAYTRLVLRTYSAAARRRLGALSVSAHLGFDDLLTSNLYLHPPPVSSSSSGSLTYFEVGARGPPAEVLHTLPSVRRLYMLKLFGTNVDTLSLSALPLLESVRCSLRQAETLIPGRPVREVALEATALDVDQLPRVIGTLLQSTESIRGLDIKLRSFDLDTFRQIGAALPRLREFVLTVLDVPNLV